jgi:hypothetical protein
VAHAHYYSLSGMADDLSFKDCVYSIRQRKIVKPVETQIGDIEQVQAGDRLSISGQGFHGYGGFLYRHTCIVASKKPGLLPIVIDLVKSSQYLTRGIVKRHRLHRSRYYPNGSIDIRIVKYADTDLGEPIEAQFAEQISHNI